MKQNAHFTMEVVPVKYTSREVLPSIGKQKVDKEVYWLSIVFYKSALCVLLISWAICLLTYLFRQRNPITDEMAPGTTSNYVDAWHLSDEDMVELISHRSHFHIFHRMEMGGIAVGFLLVAGCLKMLPQAVYMVDVPKHTGSVLKRRHRASQTTGPYLKKFRRGMRHLEDVSKKVKAEKGVETRRRKKVFVKYSLAVKMLVLEIRSKEKLIGFLKTRMQCSISNLKEVTSTVKIARVRLDVQREQNKSIIDQLEYFTQVAQSRQ